MYYPYFLTYMLIGFVLSLAIFLWALNNGQFKDQKRARFLPLEGIGDAVPAKAPKIGRIETYALFGLACAGLIIIAMVLTAFGFLRSGTQVGVLIGKCA